MDKSIIKFPINFNAIGLNYKMTHAHFDNSEDVSYLRSRCQKAIHDTIQMYGSELMRGGELHLENGTQYYIEKTLASGSYGTTAIIRNRSTSELYCLKCQNIRDDDDELDCFKEAMMHHILDIHTRAFMDYKSSLIPTLYHLVRSNKVSGPIYFIMDLMSDSLSNRLNKIPSDYGRLHELMECLVHITPTLNLLYEKGYYNHGDLHTGNVMYDARDGSYKLIDYGFSRIQIGGVGENGHTMALSGRNARSDASRDLTHLISAFEMYHRGNRMVYREGSYEHAVEQLIKRVVYEGRCSGLGLHTAHVYNLINRERKMPYDHFTRHTNENGTHERIKQAINEMKGLDVLDESSSLELMPYASPAASSSFRAPRTPRAGRAASAAVRAEEIGQMNQQYQGCMLILLIMILFTMRGAAWLYYGKGGRDPTMKSLLNNSYQSVLPVIPSKHITYESISFPNKSIQMKYSKTRNNSKTRTNRSLSIKNRNNTRRRSHKIPYAKIEDFDKLSLVSFYHYLRFEAFPGVSQKEKKEMLKEAAMVPLQRPDVFGQIVEAVKENDFDHMMAILKENQLDLSKLSKLSKLGMEIEPYQELWNSILDAYFSEKDYPLDLLQTLLHVGGNVEDFLEQYRPANKEAKKMMVMKTCITTSDCPDLMLE